MPEKEEKAQDFVVVDRRRFNDSGDAREGAPVRESDISPEIGARAEHKAESKVGASKSATPERKAGSQSQELQGQSKEPQGDASFESLDFRSFIVSLATQALVMLGEVPNPETGQVTIHLEAAQQTIDILGMLQEKTKGNLSVEEDKLLNDILVSVRMAFVKKRR